MLKQFHCGAAFDDPAFKHDHYPIGYLSHNAQIMGDKYHSHPFFFLKISYQL